MKRMVMVMTVVMTVLVVTMMAGCGERPPELTRRAVQAVATSTSPQVRKVLEPVPDISMGRMVAVSKTHVDGSRGGSGVEVIVVRDRETGAEFVIVDSLQGTAITPMPSYDRSSLRSPPNRE